MEYDIILWSFCLRDSLMGAQQGLDPQAGVVRGADVGRKAEKPKAFLKRKYTFYIIYHSGAC
jgi:hypothetical protein